jgi:hypothetical protein
MLGPGNIVWREGKEFGFGPVDANGGYTVVFHKTWTAVCPYFWVIRETGNELMPFTISTGRELWQFSTWEKAAQFAFEQILMRRLKGEA